MKKIILAVLIAVLISISACQKQVTQKPSEIKAQPIGTTGDAATDSFGNGVSNVNSEDKELSSSELDGIDSGFSDVENI